MTAWKSETDFQSKWNQYNASLNRLKNKIENSDNPSEEQRILYMFKHTGKLFNCIKQHAEQKLWYQDWINAEGRITREELISLKQILYPNIQQNKPNTQVPEGHRNPSSSNNDTQEKLARDKKINELTQKIEEHTKKDPYGKFELIIQLEEEEKKSRKEHNILFEFLNYIERFSTLNGDFDECCKQEDLDTVKIYIEFFNDYPSLDYRNNGLLTSVKEGKLETVKYLLENGGANPNYEYKEMNLAHLAAYHNHPVVLNYLYEKYNRLCNEHTFEGPQINDNGEETILHLAIRGNAVNCFRVILGFKNIDKYVNSQDQSGYTPLHTAVYNGKVNFTKDLLPHADLSIRNKEGKTAQDLAKDKGDDKGWLISFASSEAKQILQLFKEEIESRNKPQTQKQYRR